MRAAQKGINNRRRTGREGRARSAAGGPVFHAGLHQPTKPHRTLPLIRWFASLTLRLMPGAVLQGSQDPADYPDHDISSHKKFGTITDGGYS